jgi:hypothetical protein
MCRPELEGTTALGRYARPAELVEKPPRDIRIVQTIGKHIHLGWAILVLDFDQAHARVVYPVRAINDPRLTKTATLAAEPARRLELLDETHLALRFR